MRWQLKPVKNKPEFKIKFLLHPRFCGGCGIGVWLEKVKAFQAWDGRYDRLVCPSCGNNSLWLTKKYAQKEFEDKK